MSAVHSQGVSEWVPTPDGRQLFAMVLDGPEGSPTVVFEAGAAATRSSWALVQMRTAAFARSIVYDRAGLGRSPADPNGCTLERMADDLGAVLDHFGPGPFVLVGHSAGGPIVRLAASRNPGRVAGLVLVDPTDESADMLFTPTFRRGEPVVVGVSTFFARLGVLRWLYRSRLDGLPQDVKDDLCGDGFSVSTMKTWREMIRTYLDDLHEWRDDPPELGDTPVVIISGGRVGNGMNAKMRAAANASHARRVAETTNARQVIAERSGHLIPLTEPELIAEEIRRVAGSDGLIAVP